MKKIKHLCNSAILLLVVMAVACGGGGDGGGGGSSSGSTMTGVFKDTNVAGLTYSSASFSGVTNAAGQYSYREGEVTTFSVGAVILGSVTSRGVVTPVHLVAGGTVDSTDVQNIVRFLLMIDDDGDPDNGITISTAVQTAAESWPTDLDFSLSESDFSDAIDSLATDCINADGGSHAIPSAYDAQEHLEGSVLCAYSGAFRGTFSGDDSGRFGIIVDAQTGDVYGAAYSLTYEDITYMEGDLPMTLDQDMAFISGFVDTGATFEGQLTSADTLSGTWEDIDTSDHGTGSGSRIGGASDALYRFTAFFNGDGVGIASMDVDDAGNVSGVAYSPEDNELLTISGTVTGSTLTCTSSQGDVIEGTLNTTTGVLYGTWRYGGGDTVSGSFNGSGCRLN